MNDEYDDCQACNGEAIPPDAIAAHESVCAYAFHDILDDGGGVCTTCGVELPACPECGSNHGRLYRGAAKRAMGT